MKLKWKFIKTPEFWITTGLSVLLAFLGTFFPTRHYYKSLILTQNSMSNAQNKAGDIVFRAGDASSGGDGGNLTVGPGDYKAGDAV